MVQAVTNSFDTREQEREAKTQDREKRKETRYAYILAALQGSPMANLKSLKDKEGGKCLISRQVRHWAKEYSNHDKSSKMACYKYYQLGHWVALCPWDPRTSRSSAKPSFIMVQQDWLKSPAPASPPVTDNHHGSGAKGATGCGRKVR